MYYTLCKSFFDFKRRNNLPDGELVGKVDLIKNDELIDYSIRRLKPDLKKRIIERINNDDEYYEIMASELQIDLKNLVSYYEKMRLKFAKKCEYFNCIRRLDNDEDELKHMRDKRER